MEMTIPVTDAAKESQSIPAADDRPIWEIVVELGEQVPEQVRDQIPHAGSIY